MESIKAHPIVALSVFVDILLVAAIVVLWVLNLQEKVVLDIKVSPTNANITIDGKEYQDGLYELNPGTATVTVSADGFKSSTSQLNLDSNHIAKLHIVLVPNDDNLNYYFSNPDEYVKLQLIGGEYAERVAKIFSITEKLPIVDFKYGGLNGASTEIVIDRDVKPCSKYYCLMVTGDKSAEHVKTKELIVEQGYKLDDYGVRYVAY